MKLKGRYISLFIILGMLITIVIIFVAVYHKKDIPTQESIIKVFNDNYNYFNKIKDYAIENEGDLYVDNNSDRLIINNEKTKNNINERPYKNLSLNSIPVEIEVSNIIYNLKFIGIYEQNGSDFNRVIVFQKTTGSSEQGIVYLSDDSGKYGMRMVKIKNGWYYYFNGNT